MKPDHDALSRRGIEGPGHDKLICADSHRPVARGEHLPVSRPYERSIDKVLDEEPGLQLIGPDHVGDDQIICSVISPLGGSLRGVVSIDENKLVGFEQAGQHRGHFLTTVRRPRHAGNLSHMSRISDRDPTERLDPFGNFIDQLDLLAGVLVEQKMKLIESCSTHQPMMLLVERI